MSVKIRRTYVTASGLGIVYEPNSPNPEFLPELLDTESLSVSLTEEVLLSELSCVAGKHVNELGYASKHAFTNIS